MFDIENSLGFLLAKCHQKAFHIFRQKLEPYNLTPPQFATLAFLWKKDGVTQVKLGELMGVDRTTISGIVDRLERTELVRRDADAADRRSWMLFLTEKGRNMEGELSPLAREFNDSLAMDLSEDERSQLVTTLAKIRFSLKHS
ncbi:MAG: MarR family winged helix-turn-helix transcriptional regulator [Bacillota bacterium]|nr:MarR family winged helix-turn-helix transcriptional regulator [Bacillota bacterium]MDW7685037.1 MarR family winged helix-turn-helix transcriptional regulator [Bacillota bacterium]